MSCFFRSSDTQLKPVPYTLLPPPALVKEAMAPPIAPEVLTKSTAVELVATEVVPTSTLPFPFTPCTASEGVELPVFPTHNEYASVPCSTERTPTGDVVAMPIFKLLFNIVSATLLERLVEEAMRKVLSSE